MGRQLAMETTLDACVGCDLEFSLVTWERHLTWYTGAVLVIAWTLWEGISRERGEPMRKNVKSCFQYSSSFFFSESFPSQFPATYRTTTVLDVQGSVNVFCRSREQNRLSCLPT